MRPAVSVVTPKRPARALVMRAGTLRDLCALLARNGRWWLVPMVGIFVVTSILLTVVTAIEYVAPFVYTVF